MPESPVIVQPLGREDPRRPLHIRTARSTFGALGVEAYVLLVVGCGGAATPQVTPCTPDFYIQRMEGAKGMAMRGFSIRHHTRASNIRYGRQEVSISSAPRSQKRR